MNIAIIATHETTSRPEFAGWMWVPLQYVLGLEKLGVKSYWVDRVSRVDPRKGPHSLPYLTRKFRSIAEEFGFKDRYCIIYDRGEQYFGLGEDDFEALVKDADLLLNLGGHLPEDSPLAKIPRRAYVDVDPGYTQIWGHEEDIGLGRHSHFFTVGQNVGRPDFRIPDLGFPWHPILPPVVLEEWPSCIDEECRRYSTVADWRGSQDAIFDTQYYGTKREEFVRHLRVPVKADTRIELALCVGQHDHEDLGLLTGHNWRVRNPYEYAGDLHSYREFIQYSRAEFSVVKSGYIKANSGWVSDRTACYLASGKPAIVQSNGFEWRLPVGKGLLTFKSVEEAVKGIEAIESDYPAHCRTARKLAEEHFDSDTVLSSILERVGL